MQRRLPVRVAVEAVCPCLQAESDTVCTAVARSASADETDKAVGVMPING